MFARAETRLRLWQCSLQGSALPAELLAGYEAEWYAEMEAGAVRSYGIFGAAAVTS